MIYEKEELLNKLCEEFNCEDCPVFKDERGKEICGKGFYNMTDEEKDYLLQLFNDPVNHPGHYETGKFECIEVMEEALGTDVVKSFCLGNAFKYLYRCKHKGKTLEDIEKARWYLDKFISLEIINLEGETENESAT